MTNRKKNFFGLFRVSIFMVVFLVLFQFFSMLFIPKDGKNELAWTEYITKAYRGEKRDSIDVLLIGDSDLYRGFSPIDCWKEYGISSCVSGKPWQSPRGAYNVLQDALRYQKPSVVVLETDMLFTKKPMISKRIVRFAINEIKAIPTNYFSGKANLVNAVNRRRDFLLNAILKSGFSEDIQTLDDGMETRINYYFPLLEYHQRWSSLNLKDITHINSVWHFASKGYIKSSKTIPYLCGFDYMNVNSAIPDEITAYRMNYLNKTIDLCNKNNIKLILICVPTNTTSGSKHNSTDNFAQANNLEFFDYNIPQAGTGFDWLTDSVDGGVHLNYSGSIKITEDLSKKLKERFQLPDHRGDSAYAQWEEDIKLFSGF